MDAADLSQELSLEVVYRDEDLIELEAVIATGDWHGRVRAYTVPQDVAAFAAALQDFTNGTAAAAEFTTGADNGIGLIALRFYRIDRAGHIAGYASLASGAVPTNHRPEQVARIAVEFRTETWALTQFVAQLDELAETQAGRATLSITPQP